MKEMLLGQRDPLLLSITAAAEAGEMAGSGSLRYVLRYSLYRVRHSGILEPMPLLKADLCT